MFAALRTRLIDLRSRIGSAAPSAPPGTGLAIFPRLPGIAPYEAAKENGTVALLSSSEIRIFNRLSLQREFQLAAVRDWNDSLRDLDAFEERFVDNKGDRLFGDAMANVDIAKLTPQQREKYSELVSAVIKRTDLLDARVRVFDAQCRLVLGGIQDETSLFRGLPR